MSLIGCSSLGVGQTAQPTEALQASPIETAIATESPVGSAPEPTISSEPSPTPTPIEPEPTPTPGPTPTPAPPAPSPSHVTGLAASDSFWNHWVTNCFFGVNPLPASLRRVYEDADLVIRGRITELYEDTWHPRGGSTTYPIVVLRVSIDELFKGEPTSIETGLVEVQIGHWPGDIESIRQNLPAHDHIWFLNLEADAYLENNLETHESDVLYYAPDYKMPTVIRGIGGQIEVIRPEWIQVSYGKRQYPLPLDGTSFEDFVQRVREMAEQSAMSAGSGGAVTRDFEPRRLFAC